MSKAVILGVQGYELLDEEMEFFKQEKPVGFILFSRNVKDKTQLKSLVKSLKDCLGNEDVPILIDQEGGRVARMKEPHWKKYPAGKYFADIYEENPAQAKELLFKNFAEIAADLMEVGINVDCAPVLDILTDKTHAVIGDRAYGKNAHQVSDLGRKVCEGLLSKGVYPVIKHIPGHGRGTSDSHLELPIVDASLEELRASDFAPFKDLRDQKFAMTAHILYNSIDKENCATTSKAAIKLIREEIGFQNILMSDDVSMKALQGSFYDKSKAILNAGCDLVLHCNGDMKEMVEINSALPQINDKFWEKFTK